MSFEQYLLSLILVAVSTIYQSQSEEIITTWPYAVTKFDGLERLFLQLRKQRTQQYSQVELQVPDRLNEETKWKICKKIFHPSRYRHAKKETEILIDPQEAKERLKNTKYRVIFKEIFEKPVKMSVANVKVRGTKYRYSNKSKLRSVLVDGSTYLEKVFTCVVQNEESMKIAVYHVSDYDYNVNEVRKGDYIVGRFVFSYDDAFNLKLDALAEESWNPNSVPSSSTAEKHYLLKRERFSPALYAEDDPVCKLDSGKKMRLCSSVLTQLRYWWQCKVVAEDQCENTPISLKTATTGSNVYSERTMTCRCLGSRYWNLPSLYVSRGYGNNEIFVYESNEGKLNVKYYVKKAAVVQDMPEPLATGKRKNIQ